VARDVLQYCKPYASKVQNLPLHRHVKTGSQNSPTPSPGPHKPQLAGSTLPTETFEIRKYFNPHTGKAKTQHWRNFFKTYEQFSYKDILHYQFIS